MDTYHSVLIGPAPATVVVTTTSLSPDALVGHDGAHHDNAHEVLGLGGGGGDGRPRRRSSRRRRRCR